MLLTSLTYKGYMMAYPLIETKIVESYISRGITTDAVRKYLVAYNNVVAFEGAQHKVYGRRLLSQMHELLGSTKPQVVIPEL